MAAIIHLLDVLERPELEGQICLCADGSRTGTAGLAALTGTCRAAAGMQTTAEPTGIRRTFTRIMRVREMMRRPVWHSDYDDVFNIWGIRHPDLDYSGRGTRDDLHDGDLDNFGFDEW